MKIDVEKLAYICETRGVHTVMSRWGYSEEQLRQVFLHGGLSPLEGEFVKWSDWMYEDQVFAAFGVTRRGLKSRLLPDGRTVRVKRGGAQRPSLYKVSLREGEVELPYVWPVTASMNGATSRDVADLAEGGASVAEIERRFRIKRHTIRRYVRMHGVCLRSRGGRPGGYDKAAIERMLKRGLSTKYVAKRAGCSTQYVSKIRMDMGLGASVRGVDRHLIATVLKRLDSGKITKAQALSESGLSKSTFNKWCLKRGVLWSLPRYTRREEFVRRVGERHSATALSDHFGLTPATVERFLSQV